MLDEKLGKIQFWLLFIGSRVFMPAVHPRTARHAAAHRGLPAQPGLADLNDSTVGAVMIGVSFVFLLVQRRGTAGKKYPAGDNPWDAHTLEWFTTSPPPHHNFYRLPQIRSERPTWDYNHPEHLGPHTATRRTQRARRTEQRPTTKAV